MKQKPVFSKVLVIDRDPGAHMLTELILEKYSVTHSIHTYKTEDAALRYLQRIKSENQFPDLILLNVEDPISKTFRFMDKLCLVKLFCPSRCQVVYVSAFFDYLDARKFFKLTQSFLFVRNFINKPIDGKQLLAVNEKPEIKTPVLI